MQTDLFELKKNVRCRKSFLSSNRSAWIKDTSSDIGKGFWIQTGLFELKSDVGKFFNSNRSVQIKTIPDVGQVIK